MFHLTHPVTYYAIPFKEFFVNCPSFFRRLRFLVISVRVAQLKYEGYTGAFLLSYTTDTIFTWRRDFLVVPNKCLHHWRWILRARDRDRDILARLRFGHQRPVNRGCPTTIGHPRFTGRWCPSRCPRIFSQSVIVYILVFFVWTPAI